MSDTSVSDMCVGGTVVGDVIAEGVSVEMDGVCISVTGGGCRCWWCRREWHGCRWYLRGCYGGGWCVHRFVLSWVVQVWVGRVCVVQALLMRV